MLDLPEHQLAVHDRWAAGMAETVKFALNCVPAEWPAALIMLADQPAVRTAELQSLLAAWQAEPTYAAAALYAGDVGAPCVLPRSMFSDVQQLQGDRGAKSLLQKLPRVTRVLMESAAHDIDTREDLAQLERRAGVGDIN